MHNSSDREKLPLFVLCLLTAIILITILSIDFFNINQNEEQLLAIILTMATTKLATIVDYIWGSSRITRRKLMEKINE